MNKKNIVIIGAGGHGIEPLLPLTQNFNTNIIYIPADWGGSTGMLGRLIEHNNYFFNRTLGAKYQFLHHNFIPAGDINKLIITQLNESKWFVEHTHILDCRTDDRQQLLHLAQALSNLFEEPLFVEFCGDLFDYYEDVKREINYHKPFALGNLWHHFLISQVGIAGLNNFYTKKQLIHHNIRIVLSHTCRQEIWGQTVVGQQTIGEDIIDDFPTAIAPESLHVRPAAFETCFNTAIVDDLYNADLVIIPNGSIANWLPLVNDIPYVFRHISHAQKLLMMGNLFYTPNELPLQNYIAYLIQKGIYPHVLLPDESWYDSLKEHILDYAKENKIPQSLKAIEAVVQYYRDTDEKYAYFKSKTDNMYNYTLATEDNIGIKYAAQSVSSRLDMFLN
jgi:hypothetical protein